MTDATRTGPFDRIGIRGNVPLRDAEGRVSEARSSRVRSPADRIFMWMDPRPS